MKPKQKGAWKFRDYLQSVFDMTQEADNKSKLFYYFPLSSLDLAKYNYVIEWGYMNDVLVVNLLWKIIEMKKNEK